MQPRSTSGLALLAVLVNSLGAALGAPSGPEIVITNALALRIGGGGGRNLVHRDPVEALVVNGVWRAPQVGESVRGPNGQEEKWETISAGREGWFEHRALRGGYALARVVATNGGASVLEAAGHNLVYVNGELRTGDPYQYGYVRLPVELKAGTNDFLFQVSRGRFRAKLTTPKKDCWLEVSDPTLPDVIKGETESLWGAVPVINATASRRTNLFLRVINASGRVGPPTPVTLLPWSVRKARFQIPVDRESWAAREVRANLELLRRERNRWVQCDRTEIKLNVRQATELQKRTFISQIDGSVQYYAVNPPATSLPAQTAPALFLSVHGASVEATGQAAAYAPHAWGVLVCPTNRRPYGFDWEEWGRLDALEVLGLAQARYHTDPRRTYLTGHSMGGHGVWTLGATFPDRFAALGPSAGWISFSSYVNRARAGTNSAMTELLERAAASSDTLAMETNYLHQGIYILHGADDDNVPVTEARRMREVLARFHHDFDYHEQPGAGHWWGLPGCSGAACVDWPPMFDLFARHQRPALAEVRRVRFTTVNPGVSSRCDWLSIEAQVRLLRPSHVDARCDPTRRRLEVQTDNVQRLAFDLQSVLPPGQPVEFELDGQKLGPLAWPCPTKTKGRPTAPMTPPEFAFERSQDRWRVAATRVEPAKSPQRYGPFKEAFQRQMLFVYGTSGTPAENDWALNKARYDSESFWYRGNGSVEVVPDTEFTLRTAGSQGTVATYRNVILYGHADCNRAWSSLLSASPVQVRRNSLCIGARELTGPDLACLFLRPHPLDPAGSVAVIAGTSISGLSLADRLPIFLSGAGFPDCLVVSPDMLTTGPAGVVAAGFFGLDWGVERGEFVWQQ